MGPSCAVLSLVIVYLHDLTDECGHEVFYQIKLFVVCKIFVLKSLGTPRFSLLNRINRICLTRGLAQHFYSKNTKQVYHLITLGNHHTVAMRSLLNARRFLQTNRHQWILCDPAVKDIKERFPVDYQNIRTQRSVSSVSRRSVEESPTGTYATVTSLLLATGHHYIIMWISTVDC